MKNVYNNHQEISMELKKLRLQRDISIEELKLVKEQFKEDLSIAHWIQSAIRTIGKVGIYNLARKVVK